MAHSNRLPDCQVYITLLLVLIYKSIMPCRQLGVESAVKKKKKDQSFYEHKIILYANIIRPCLLTVHLNLFHLKDNFFLSKGFQILLLKLYAACSKTL